MRVIAHISPGPQWRQGRTVFQQGEAVEQHLDFMRARYDDGSLLIGGPRAGGMSGIAVLEVPDLHAAQTFAEADPAVAAGVLVYEVGEVCTFFDVVSGARAGGMTAPVDAVGGQER
jgi:uncharacterized protein YciI